MRSPLGRSWSGSSWSVARAAGRRRWRARLRRDWTRGTSNATRSAMTRLPASLHWSLPPLRPPGGDGCSTVRPTTRRRWCVRTPTRSSPWTTRAGCMAPRRGSFFATLAYPPGRWGAHLHLPALDVVGAYPTGALGCADARRAARGDRHAPCTARGCPHPATPVHLPTSDRDMAHQPSPLNQAERDPFKAAFANTPNNGALPSQAGISRPAAACCHRLPFEPV